MISVLCKRRARFQSATHRGSLRRSFDTVSTSRRGVMNTLPSSGAAPKLIVAAALDMYILATESS